MEYHEIGERFKYNDVVLEVVEIADLSSGVCNGCYLADLDTPCFGLNKCSADKRNDKKDVVYKLVQQCKQKDMEQKELIEEKDEERCAILDKETNRPVFVQGKFNDEDLYGYFLDKLFTTYKAKDKDYGSAFSEMFDELGINYAYGKLREKINRIKVLRNQPNMVENEGLEDALLDTAGYAILTLVELKKRKQ